MRKFFGSLIVFFILVLLSSGSKADIGDIFIQVDLPGLDPDGCSIMMITPDGSLSEFISNDQILAVTGLTGSDCADTGLTIGQNGFVYFSEDISDNILVATPGGSLFTFVTDTVVNMLVPLTVDWDNGMDTNPVTGALVAADEDNDAIFEFPTNSFPITDPDQIKILADEADFETLVTTVDLEGGIAIDDQGNIYISNDGGENNVDDVIFKLTSTGDLSILCTGDEITTALGVAEIDLDVGMAINGKLYVGEDGDCDCIFEVDPVTCDPEVLITDDEIIALTGNNNADLEGGVCLGPDMNLYVGDDGDIDGDGGRPSVIKVPVDFPGGASLFVSTTEIRSFYSVLEPLGDPRLQGSCDVQRNDAAIVPTLSEWGMISMAAILGLVGFIVARKRMVKA